MGGGTVAPTIDPAGDEEPETVDRDALTDDLFRALAGDV